MENEKTLTQTELLKELNRIKDAFFRSGSAENLCLSLKDVLERGLDKHLINQDFSALFTSIFLGHDNPTSRSSRYALVSAVRSVGIGLDKRKIKKNIVRALVSHPLVHTDPCLRSLLKHIAPITGSIDEFIKEYQFIPV